MGAELVSASGEGSIGLSVQGTLPFGLGDGLRPVDTRSTHNARGRGGGRETEGGTHRMMDVKARSTANGARLRPLGRGEDEVTPPSLLGTMSKASGDDLPTVEMAAFTEVNDRPLSKPRTQAQNGGAITVNVAHKQEGQLHIG
eukprot:11823129-Alexandrium_andersonii.AAC.1